MSKLADGQADVVLVDESAAIDLNERAAEIPGAWHDPSSPEVSVRVELDVLERIAFMQEQLALGRYVEGEAGSLARAAAIAAQSTTVDHQRLVLEETSLFCVPLESGLFKSPIDFDFDRNRCASLHPAERIRVLRRSADGAWLYAHAGHTVGWLHDGALSPRLSKEQLDAWTSSRRLVPLRDDVTTRDGFLLRLGVSVPLLESNQPAGGGWSVLVPDADGVRETTVAPGAAVHEGYPPLTRRDLWAVAFSELRAPYGWGGRAGERDCSSFLRDALSTYGIQFARHSGVQAELGTDNVDLQGLTEREKLGTIEHWAGRGVVLLYMPGHIMLYLGADGDQHYAISAMSEYLEPCEGGADTVHRIDSVAVTTLEIGRDTERTAFIERLTRLVAFAPPRASARAP